MFITSGCNAGYFQLIDPRYNKNLPQKHTTDTKTMHILELSHHWTLESMNDAFTASGWGWSYFNTNQIHNQIHSLSFLIKFHLPHTSTSISSKKQQAIIVCQATIDLSISFIFPAFSTATIHMGPQSETAVTGLPNGTEKAAEGW